MNIITDIKPSVFLKEVNNVSMQLIHVYIESSPATNSVELIATWKNRQIGSESFASIPGVNSYDFFIEELFEESNVTLIAKFDGAGFSKLNVTIYPPRHWTIHVVQASHHDLGYTDLSSNVLQQHSEYLNEAIDFAEQTADYPFDARFRIVVEQMWSLNHFIKTACKERTDKIIKLLQNRQFEMTALFGNITGELCNHETLIRAAYHSATLARRYGIPLLSAEHNDIPGLSWGISRVLTDIGVKLFFPGFPMYHTWAKDDPDEACHDGQSEVKYRMFWDADKIFDGDKPGVFWWEAPSGKRLLLWSNDQSCGDIFSREVMLSMERELVRLEQARYHYSTLRCNVSGGWRDNTPYIRDFADIIRDWNAKWTYPHLICSTNAMFYHDLKEMLPADLPVFRGELPGQDYLSGATSTSLATSVNCRNQTALINAEKLASYASLYTDYHYQDKLLSSLAEEILLYNEHTWGYHYPAGPTARAALYEKAVHAFRAEAHAAEVRDKAMAHIVDNLKLQPDNLYLVVFNQTSWPLSTPISVPLREPDGTGNAMRLTEQGSSKGYVLGYRWHVYPESYDNFDLEDVSSGQIVPMELVKLRDAFEPVDHAPERVGLGSGTKRYGLFEDPVIIKHELFFVAEDIPAHGYKTYRLIPRETRQSEYIEVSDQELNETDEPDSFNYMIENEFYIISADAKRMEIVSIYDKKAGRELVDKNGGGFYRLIVRDKNQTDELHESRTKITVRHNAIRSFIEFESLAYGHPVVRHRISLYSGIKNIYFETCLSKDATPMLNVHLAFPLQADEPRFRYESGLSIQNPVKDYFPGAFSDLIGIQSWVCIQDNKYYTLWSSFDAPAAGFCKLWLGNVSPAHRCYNDKSIIHDPQTELDYMQNGWIFSQLCNNNFGTNFYVSQQGTMIFRYCLTSGEGRISDPEAVRWGWQVTTYQSTMFTDRASMKGSLPHDGQFISIDTPEVAILNLKAAEDGNGYILRLWNFADANLKSEIRLAGKSVHSANLTNLTENDITNSGCLINNGALIVEIDPGEIINARIYF